jgi:hypothetical protein
MHVFAYVDPGSGSLLIQAAIAAIAGVATIPMLLRRRISAALRSRRAVRADDRPEAPPQEQ